MPKIIQNIEFYQILLKLKVKGFVNQPLRNSILIRKLIGSVESSELKIEIQNSFESIKDKKNLFTCKPLKVDFHSVCENEAVLELNV